MARAEKRQRKKENARLAREAREAALKRKRQRRSAITAGLIALPFIALFLFLSLRGNHKSSKSAAKTTTTAVPAKLPAGCVATVPKEANVPHTYAKAPAMTIDPSKTYTATMQTTCGTIVMTLDPKEAPK